MTSLNKFIITLSALIIMFVITGCDSGGDSADNEPSVSMTPLINTSSCTAPALDTPFISDNVEEFFIFSPDGGTLDVRVFSDGANVFLIASDEQTVFGFTGVPLDSGSSCALISASADFNFDGVFDETAINFMGDCAVEEGGSKLMLLNGTSSVGASEQFNERLLIFYNQTLLFNILNNIACSTSEAVSSAGIFNSLLSELQARAGQ